MNIDFKQVNVLPAELEAGTLYFVKDGADKAKLYVTNTSGTITARLVHDGEASGQGGALAYRGVVADVANLPATAATGDAYAVSADEHLHIWDGTRWTDAGPLAVGTPGLQGIQGPQGNTGATGATGRGITSTAVDLNSHLRVTYTDGQTQDAGVLPVGPQGVPGPAGAQGPKGDPGSGGSITVINSDGSITGVVDTIKLANGTVAIDGTTAIFTPAGGGGTAAPSTTTNPTFKTAFTVANPDAVASSRVVRLVFTTAHALASGADIRVFSQSGTETVRLIGGAFPSVGGYTYAVFFRATLPANSSENWTVTYGDLNAAPPSYPANEIKQLATYSQGKTIDNSWAYMDSSQAYIPTDFETAGAGTLGQRDDAESPETLSNSVVWNGVAHDTVYHYSNGGLRFVSGPIGQGIRVSDDLEFIIGDAYESWRRTVALSDGIAWHILSGASGWTADQRITIRYYTALQRWTMTYFASAASINRLLSVRANSVEFSANIAGLIDINHPEQSQTLVVEPVPVTPTGMMENTI